MSFKLDKKGYQNLIDEDIQELIKWMPENSLEKKHIIAVLKWSIDQIYNSDDTLTVSLDWWDTLKYDIRNKLSQKYYHKNEPISLSEIKTIWLLEKDNVDYWTKSEDII